MRTIVILIFTLFAAFGGPSSSRADEDLLLLLEQVPANIHHVESGGYWAHSSDEGFFRVLIMSDGIEHVSHSLYIQWVKVDVQTGAYSVERTRAVAELAGGAEHLLQVDTSFGDINRFVIDVIARQRIGEPRHFVVTVNGGGTYSIQAK